MHIRWLTQSTWKVRNGEARITGETTPCCPPPIHSQVSERGELLGWWRPSHFLSPLSCCLSSFYWGVNCLPCIWTRSGVFYLSSPRPRSPCHHAMASWAARAKRYINPIYFNRKPVMNIHTYLHTYIHTYKHNLRLRPHYRPLRLHDYEPYTKAFGNKFHNHYLHAITWLSNIRR